MQFTEYEVPDSVVLQQLVWVIMDLGEKLIARGTTKLRYICLIDAQDTNRVLTFRTRGDAKRGYTYGKFDVKPEAAQYILEQYGVSIPEFVENRAMYLQPVECMLALEKC